MNGIKMHLIRIHKNKDLTIQQVRSIVIMIDSVWSQDKSVEQLVEEYDIDNNDTVIVAWDNDNAIAHARVFPRIIKVESVNIEVLCLGGVCVSPNRRKENLGKMVSEKAFEIINKGEYRFCLFQTEVPEFYRKMGAIEVSNIFYNSENINNPNTSPWWDEHIMIYSKNINEWPTGSIDLNGSAY
jgi:predicted GNAT family N-acyltransferase